MNDFEIAKQHLQKADSILGKLIESIDLSPVTPQNNYFQALTESIISQQLSIKAADTITARFVVLFGSQKFPSPLQVLHIDPEKIRSAGISYQKISYIKDLAQKTHEKLVDLNKIAEMPDADVILHLTEIKGIGKWTAEMFLMFSLGRPDVFSYGDLGLKKAMRKIYNLKNHPSEKKAMQLSNKWRPYRTTACRYLWKSLDNTPIVSM